MDEIEFKDLGIPIIGFLYYTPGELEHFMICCWLLLFASQLYPARADLCSQARKSTRAYTLQCPANCTDALQAALYSGASHIRVLPPKGGGTSILGSDETSTRLIANGTDQIVEFAPGLELIGFLNNTYYPSTGSTTKRGYSPALVTLRIAASNLTLCGSNTVLRHITSSVSGKDVRIEGLHFIDPGWDGLYARGL